ncbi:hypothetical protein SAV31267_001440 [Streptomyces avermitilis]|uniref:Uncharacterized protein n=1 Tax=Streptomyces avermitilis TaxID=33903 RepID=A0A4D4MGL4_STRAX|nr:hypothetical protein SAV31267_001440 [Streptomyces avermitilis]
MVASVLVGARPDAGSAPGAAQLGPRLGCAAVKRRPAHLTVREEQILACIRLSIAERGEGLTILEIGRAVGL